MTHSPDIDPADYVGLAWSVARDVGRAWREDPRLLVGAAMEGVIRARRTFDPDCGVFSDHAWSRARTMATSEVFRLRGWAPKGRQLHVRFVPESECRDLPDPAARPDAQYEVAEGLPRLAAALRELDPKLRDVLERRYVGGETYEKIAKAYDSPKQTAAWWEQKALRLLRKRMKSI